MSETEQLRTEVAELREAVLVMAYTMNTVRGTFFSTPRGHVVGDDSSKDHLHLTQLCYWLTGLATNTANIGGAPWLVALEQRSGVPFDERHRQQREIIEKEGEIRAELWKKAEAWKKQADEAAKREAPHGAGQ